MTADLEKPSDLDDMGPVGYLVVAFPTDRMTGEAFPLLVDLVDRGIIRILDLMFLRKDEDGTVTTLTQVDLDRMKVLEAALFDGATSGLLGPEDVAEAAAALDPGTAAGLLVYENVWATPFAAALRRSGGQLGGLRPHPGPGPRRALDALEAEEQAAAESVPAQAAGRLTSSRGLQQPGVPVRLDGGPFLFPPTFPAGVQAGRPGRRRAARSRAAPRSGGVRRPRARCPGCRRGLGAPG